MSSSSNEQIEQTMVATLKRVGCFAVLALLGGVLACEKNPMDSDTPPVDLDQYVPPANGDTVQVVAIIETYGVVLAWDETSPPRPNRFLRSVDDGDFVPHPVYFLYPGFASDSPLEDGRQYAYRLVRTTPSGEITSETTIRYLHPVSTLRALESVFENERPEDFISLLDPDFLYFGIRRDHTRVQLDRDQLGSVFGNMFSPQHPSHVLEALLGFDATTTIEHRGQHPTWTVVSTLDFDATFNGPVLGETELSISHGTDLALRRSADGREWRVFRWRDLR
jgi:hypothetical protein